MVYEIGAHRVGVCSSTNPHELPEFSPIAFLICKEIDWIIFIKNEAYVGVRSKKIPLAIRCHLALSFCIEGYGSVYVKGHMFLRWQ